MLLKIKNISKKFFLEKWFLDLVTEAGETQIFYAAHLRWRAISLQYASWLWLFKSQKTGQKSRLRNVQLPILTNNSIKYSDAPYRVEGTWIANAGSIKALIFESDEGNIEWTCFQPSSTVYLKVNDTEWKGLGYVEKIKIPFYPWKMPIQQLRWGRFVSAKDYLVWIELKSETTKQWVWYNGEKMQKGILSDQEISIPEKHILLQFTDTTIIESEKKIYNVVKKIFRFLPGFYKLIPTGFLMADENKWRSRGILKNKNTCTEGWVIHELVNFKT